MSNAFKPRERHIRRGIANFIIRYTPARTLQDTNIIHSVRIDIGAGIPQLLFLDTLEAREHLLKLLGLVGFGFYEDLFPITTKIDQIDTQGAVA